MASHVVYWHRLCATLLLSVPVSAGAQEAIFDPENPAVSDGDADTSAGAEASGETIFDPDNPATPESQNTASEPFSGDAAPSSAVFLGDYRTALSVDARWDEDEDIVEWNNQMGLRIELDVNPSLRVVAGGRFQHVIVGRENTQETDLLINASEPRAAYTARLGETWVRWRGDRWTLRAGHMVHPWGSTDLVRPGDVVNPRDLSDPAATDGTGLLPQLSAEVSYQRPDWALTGLVVPFFVPNEVVIFGRDTALANGRNPLLEDQLPVLGLLQSVLDQTRWEDYQPVLLSTEEPEERPANASLGARMTATLAGMDLGVGYFWGWDRTPQVQIDPDLRRLLEIAARDGQVLVDFDLLGFAGRNAGVIELVDSISEAASSGEKLIEARYLRQHTVVLDAARYLGPVGVRVDAALSPQRTFYTESLESVRRPTWHAALGISWEYLGPGESALALVGEGFVLQPLPADSPLTEALVDRRDAGASDRLLLIEEAYTGALAAVQWSMPRRKLDVQAGGFYSPSTRGLVLTGGVTYRWRSWLRGTAGFSVLAGPNPSSGLSIGGIYDANDQVHVGVEGQL